MFVVISVLLIAACDAGVIKEPVVEYNVKDVSPVKAYNQVVNYGPAAGYGLYGNAPVAAYPPALVAPGVPVIDNPLGIEAGKEGFPVAVGYLKPFGSYRALFPKEEAHKPILNYGVIPVPAEVKPYTASVALNEYTAPVSLRQYTPEVALNEYVAPVALKGYGSPIVYQGYGVPAPNYVPYPVEYVAPKVGYAAPGLEYAGYPAPVTGYGVDLVERGYAVPVKGVAVEGTPGIKRYGSNHELGW